MLRFDDNPVMHQLSSYIASPDPAWIGMFMTLDLPATTPVGIHEIELYVPHDGGIRGPMCGNEPHPVRLWQRNSDRHVVTSHWQNVDHGSASAGGGGHDPFAQ